MQDTLPPALRALTKGFNSASDHVIITDNQGKIVYANKAAEKHTGYTISEMLGQKPGELWGGHMSREFYDEMWEVIGEQKSAYVCELQNCTKNGKKYWQEVHILPILNTEGNPELYIGIELDVDAEERRQDLIQEYQRNAATHLEQDIEIRWPLGWLLETANLSQKQLTDLQQQYANDNALDCLVEDLVAISNVVFANKQPDEEFCVIRLLQEVIHEIQDRFPNSNIDLKSAGHSSIALVENRRLLKELLSRIIINAVQYTKPDVGDVILTLLKTDNLCVMKCEDDGIGVAFHEQKRMFDKFFRGARARRVNPNGSGLGLYLVKSIADVRGWTIACVSEPNKGAMFSVKIPIQQHVKQVEKVVATV